MVKLALRLLLGALVLAVGFWVWTILFPSPQKIIRGRLEQMGRLASFSSSQNALLKAAASQKLAALFAPHVEVRVDAPGVENHEFTSREDLYEAILAAKAAARSLHVKIYDINVAVTSGHNEAIADAALRADVADQKDALVEQLKFTFKNIEGEWLVTSVVSEK